MARSKLSLFNASLATRRDFLRTATAAAMWAGLAKLAPGYAQVQNEQGRPASTSPSPHTGELKTADLVIAETEYRIGDRVGRAVTVNGSLPAPLLRFREGDDVELRVTNRLRERSSIHWHGILVPAEMDGVPGVSFKGIDPGETFTYRFQIKQYGTYWYHSHSGLRQLQQGFYGPLVFHPAEPEPYPYDREHIVILSDWTFADPDGLFAKLKKQSNFSNLQRRTAGDFFGDVSAKGFKKTWSEWSEWAKMRMDPTDIADLTGTYFTYLVNGQPAATPWTGIFRPGERVRLRFINSAATTHFDVRIPGLKMIVVEADGQHVKPVEVEEFRMGAAETFDVLVEPKEDRAYSIFAETTDRSGYALGTLATREGMTAEVPPRRKRPVRTMADMGMGGHEMGVSSSMQHGATQHEPPRSPAPASGAPMDHGAHGIPGSGSSTPAASVPPASGGGAHAGHGGMQQPSQAPTQQPKPPADAHAGMPGMSGMSGMPGMKHGEMEMPKNEFGPANSMMAMSPQSRAHEPGTGLGDDGWRVLVYRDLVALHERPVPAPTREIVLNATGNMERFIWGFDGKKFSEAEPIPLRFNERVRITFINQTMMEHPLHLHGMFMELENGAEGLPPLKHTVTVKPGEKISVLVTADAPGNWSFHCHLQYHMEAGMFRVFTVA